MDTNGRESTLDGNEAHSFFFPRLKSCVFLLPRSLGYDDD